MYLSDIFEQLTHGELAHITIGGNGDEVLPSDYKKIIPHINLGLTELHKRFNVKLNEVIIDLYEHIQIYYLDQKYAQSNNDSTEPVKYISDSQFQPFRNDLLQILTVYNENGEELFLNDASQPYSVYTPSFNAIQIPYNYEENSLGVIYRATPDKIVYTPTIDPSTYWINLPNTLLEPLLYYIASRAFSVLNTDQNVEGNNYMQKFEMSVQRIIDLGLMNKDTYINNRLELAGWV